MFSIRRAIEREENNLLDDHKRQYFYLISWFLRAETARRKKQAHDRARRPGNSASALEAESYSLVASVLNQETFVLLQRTMVHAQEQKIWLDLNASMKCFTQILLTVQDMTESPLDEDQEIAENILNRIFYEQSTHDIVVTLLRTYVNQGFGYLDACTQLAHTFCRLLENYAKQNVDLQVRSRRRARKKDSQGTDAQTQRKQNREMEAEDVATAERTSTERRFDFAKFAAKYVNQQTMNTFVAFLRFYRDFNPDQLKRAHRFFYRAAFKMEQTVYLFRLDIIALLNKLIKGPAGLDDDGPMFKDWSELVRQVFRRLTKRMEERPALAVELLFSKIPATTYFLEHGYDREVPVKQKRAPAELEVKPGMELEEQIGVVVSILINQGKADVLAWVKDELNKAATERQSWLDLHTAQKTVEQQSKAPLPPPRGEADQIFESVELRPSQDADTEADTPRCPSILFTTDNAEHNKAMANDKYVRLLLTTLLFQRLGEDTAESPASWIIPSSLSVEHLTTSAAWIAKFEFAPPTYDDDKGAEDFVRRKAAIRARAEKESDVSDNEGASDIDGLFADNLPDQTRATGEGKDKTKPKRKRLRHKKDELLDASVLDARRAARQQAEAEKSRKIKSALYVHASDDDSDEEADRLFFAAEEERRKKNNLGGGRVVKEDGTVPMRKAGKGKQKRKSTMPAEDDHETEVQSSRATKRRRSTKKALLDESDDAIEDYAGSDSNHDISQMSSPEPTSQARSRPRKAAPFDDDSDEEMRPVLSDTGDETDTPPSSVPVPGETSRKKQQTMETESDAEVDIIMDDAHTRKDSDKENEEVGGSNGEVLKNGVEATAGQRGRRRAGFVLDDDSDDE
jgi:replication fork protection complex subunit Tof1/Swi1